jgi:pSer/pThr/pTyr-binding forkhead associated (FHA) protein
MMHSGVRPYLMDLGSANGTYLNNDRIETERYYELFEKVCLRHAIHASLVVA